MDDFTEVEKEGLRQLLRLHGRHNTWRGMQDFKGQANVYGALSLKSIVEYANNAAAVAAGLQVGMLYRTGDALKVVHS